MPCVDEAVENKTVQKQKARGGDVVDGMDSVCRRLEWNSLVWFTDFGFGNKRFGERDAAASGLVF